MNLAASPMTVPDRSLSVCAARRLLDALATLGEMLTLAALALDTAITFASTVLRVAIHRDLGWGPDVSAILIPIIAFIGGPCFFRRGGGMTYRALLDRLGGLARTMLEALGHWIIVAVCVLSLLQYPAFLSAQGRQRLPVLGIPTSATAIWLGLGLALLALFTLERIVRLRRDGAAVALPVALALVALSLLVRSLYASGALELDPFWLIAPAVVLVFLLGVPVPLILAMAGGVYFVLTGDAPLVAIPTAFQYGVTSFILLAIPFFMAAGALMEISGMARQLVETVQRWCGHWPAGC